MRSTFKNPENLRDLMEKPGFFDIVATPLTKSPGEIFLMTLKFSISNMLTQTAVSNLLRLINNLFIEPIFPDSRYFIDKLFNPKSNVEFHAVCPTCSEYVGKVEDVDSAIECQVCHNNVDLSNPSCLHFFVMINPSTSIAELIEEFQDYYDYVMQERRHEKKHLKDIYDGKCYRTLVSSLPDGVKQKYATVTFNTDGIPAFECSQNSIWPIQLMINELPVQERFRNLITCGLWFGRSKPNMDIFMKPFRDMMNNIFTSGIKCTIKEESRLIHTYAVACCADAVARAPMQGIKQFNGNYGCGWCLHPGVYMREMKSLKYPVLNYDPEARTRQNTVQFMEEFQTTKKPVRGIQSVSPLLNLIRFNIILGFIPDYMHCILIGVAKQITELMLNLLSSADVSFLSAQLLRIGAPNQLVRLTRGLDHRKCWKAREWENWVLYYSLPILSMRLEEKFVKHWSLLVEGLYILLQTDITYEQLEHSDILLNRFVVETEQLYTKKAMTFNIHQLLHMAKSVYNWGPLWAHSTFAFEAGNAGILKAIKCARGVNLQILRYMNLTFNVSILEKNVFPNTCEIVKEYCKQLTAPRMNKFCKVSGITYLGKGGKITDDLHEFADIDICLNNTLVYTRMVKEGCLYLSHLKNNKRSNNCTAQLIDGRFIRIVKFAVDKTRNTNLTLCNVIQTGGHNLSDNYSILKKIRCVETEISLVPTTDIRRICIYIEVGCEYYVCPLPNLYFY